jgi:hypothetical protein
MLTVANKNKSSGRRRRDKKRPVSNQGPAPSQLTYYGSLAPSPAEALEVRTEVVGLQLTIGLVSTVGGVLANSYGNAPSSAADWASWANVYDEYRTLGFSIHYIPTNQYGKSANTPICRMMMTVVDNDSGGALGSFASAAAYESCKPVSLEHPWQLEQKMSGPLQATFVTTAAPAASGWIKFYTDSLTASTEYGIMFFRWLVQFRGRN